MSKEEKLNKKSYEFIKKYGTTKFSTGTKAIHFYYDKNTDTITKESKGKGDKKGELKPVCKHIYKDGTFCTNFRNDEFYCDKHFLENVNCNDEEDLNSDEITINNYENTNSSSNDVNSDKITINTNSSSNDVNSDEITININSSSNDVNSDKITINTNSSSNNVNSDEITININSSSNNVNSDEITINNSKNINDDVNDNIDYNKLNIINEYKNDNINLTSNSIYNEITYNIKSNTHIGDEIEKQIFNILLNIDFLYNVKNIGRKCDKMDIIYKVSGETEYRGIQVKIISCEYNSYYFNTSKTYTDDTLIVASNQDGTKRCLMFYKEVKDKTRFTLKYNKEYNDRIFYNNEINEYSNLTFEETLKIMCKKSDFYVPTKNHNNIIEELGYDFLEKICLQNNLEMSYILTHDSSIDVVINGKNIQCKTSTVIKRKNTKGYKFSIHHNCKGEKGPYDESDNIDFFIFMPAVKKSDNSEDITFEDVYIVPKCFMIAKNYISVNKKGGKTTMIINGNSKIYRQFNNNFNLLKLDSLKIEQFKVFDDIVSEFNNECLERNIIFERNLDNFTINEGFIKGHQIVFRKMSNRESPRKSMFCDFGKIYDEKNCPDFFVMTNKNLHNTFIILPKSYLIDYGVVRTSFQPGKKSLTISDRNNMEKNDDEYIYVNNFDQFLELEDKVISNEITEDENDDEDIFEETPDIIDNKLLKLIMDEFNDMKMRFNDMQNKLDDVVSRLKKYEEI
jgi:hypothetical protein